MPFLNYKLKRLHDLSIEMEQLVAEVNYKIPCTRLSRVRRVWNLLNKDRNYYCENQECSYCQEHRIKFVYSKVYKTCDICCMMRDSGLFLEGDIEAYHNEILTIKDFNAEQKQVFRDYACKLMFDEPEVKAFRFSQVAKNDETLCLIKE